MDDEELARLRRETLATAFVDAEGTVRATDTKASIALILHGLLFGGLVSVTKDLGASYSKHETLFKISAATLLLLTTFAFLCSVVQLLRCVAPAPSWVVPRMKSLRNGVFYITDERVSWNRWEMPDVDEIRARLLALDAADIENELLGELIAVSAIRQRKIRLVKSGYLMLAAEVTFAVAYLGLLAGAAA